MPRLTPEQERQAHALLSQLIDASPEQRQAALRGDGVDPLVREEVEAMLSIEEPELFDEGQLGGLGAALANDAREAGRPERIGAYRIVELLGEGGMGSVYLAEQEQPIRRRVALKVIRIGMETEAVMARFRLESDAIARMNHDAIAKVYEFGATDAGQPFFAMELVDGAPLTQWCDDNRRDVRARVELFVQVCRGVHHAHQKGIVHRDLKPSNVLVADGDGGGDGVAKIIDFGIARDQSASGEAAATQAGARLGTPAYMSPEQLLGDLARIDTRTDVYALGVMLY